MTLTAAQTISPEQLGAALQRLMHNRGITGSDLAQRSGLSVSYVSLLGGGSRKWNLDATLAVCVGLGLPIQVLLHEANPSIMRAFSPDVGAQLTGMARKGEVRTQD